MRPSKSTERLCEVLMGSEIEESLAMFVVHIAGKRKRCKNDVDCLTLWLIFYDEAESSKWKMWEVSRTRLTVIPFWLTPGESKHVSSEILPYEKVVNHWFLCFRGSD